MKILIAVDGSACTREALDRLVANRAMLVDGHEFVAVHVRTDVSVLLVQ